MSSCKIALFLAFVSIAIASASCKQCYSCNSATGDKECDKPQKPDVSRTANCGTTKEDGACIKAEFTTFGTAGTARACIEAYKTCDDYKKNLALLGIHVTDCNICKDDLCNGK